LRALAPDDPTLTVAVADEADRHGAFGRYTGEVACGTTLGVTVGSDLRAICRAEHVVLDFTAPVAALAHARVAAECGAALVVGTTGLDREQDAALRAQAARTRAVIAPNMSVGVTVLTELVARAARLLGAGF